MGRTREILRQKWVLKRSHREVASSIGCSVGVVGKTVSRATAVHLTWEAVEALDDASLEKKLYGQGAASGEVRPEPDCAWIHTERKRVGVTLELLHIEYLEAHPNGLKYTRFCDRYRQWLKKRRLSMRQNHRAGDKLFVDFSGKKPKIINPNTGEIIDVELFVAVLGASNFTYAEATMSQKGPDWIRAHVHAFEFFGGVSRAIVPDQLKSGVTKSCHYDPEIQRTYEEMAEHYGTVVFPARPGKPKDKAKVEVGVQVVTRWILGRIRNETFFTLEALNERILELLDALNARVMKRYGKSRRQLFETLDQPALEALPKDRFEYGSWKTATVNIDYHVESDRHFYSVPHRLRGEKVDVRLSASVVEIFYRRRREAIHPRSYRRGHHTTQAEHMPKAHRAHLQWSPSRIIHWAGTIGPKTAELVQDIMESRPHPEMGYRTSLGIIRLEKTYGKERLERACARALHLGARSYRHVQATLKNGMDRIIDEVEPPSSGDEEGPPSPSHENIRGSGYYH